MSGDEKVKIGGDYDEDNGEYGKLEGKRLRGLIWMLCWGSIQNAGKELYDSIGERDVG